MTTGCWAKLTTLSARPLRTAFWAECTLCCQRLQPCSPIRCVSIFWNVQRLISCGPTSRSRWAHAANVIIALHMPALLLLGVHCNLIPAVICSSRAQNSPAGADDGVHATPVQAADFLFGASAQPHDLLHEPLMRILSTGTLTAGAIALALRVRCLSFPQPRCMPRISSCLTVQTPLACHA